MFFVQVAGNLGKDPETRFTPAGLKVTTFSIAVNQRKGQQETTTWVRVTVWGDRHDKFISFLKKGSAVIVSGKMNLPLNFYTDKEGKTQCTLEVTAEMLEFSPFGKPQEGGQGQGQGQSQHNSQSQDQYNDESQFQQNRQPYAGAGKSQGTSQSTSSNNEDDLPF